MYQSMIITLEMLTFFVMKTQNITYKEATKFIYCGNTFDDHLPTLYHHPYLSIYQKCHVFGKRKAGRLMSINVHVDADISKTWAHAIIIENDVNLQNKDDTTRKVLTRAEMISSYADIKVPVEMPMASSAGKLNSYVIINVLDISNPIDWINAAEERGCTSVSVSFPRSAVKQFEKIVNDICFAAKALKTICIYGNRTLLAQSRKCL